MTQDELLKIITENPGIKQNELEELTGLGHQTVFKQIQKLLKWKEIKRIPYTKKFSNTYKLYPLRETT